MGFYIAVMLGSVIVGVVSFFLTKDTYGYMATYGREKKECGKHDYGMPPEQCVKDEG